ncbi:MAG: CotH kinase family protein, partial [Verrucomicrobiota bacterium]
QYPWHKQMFTDPEFSLEYADRWYSLRRGIFSTESLMATIDGNVAEIYEGQERNFEKWRRLGTYDWPNAPGVQDRDTYDKVVDFMKDWLDNRVDWMDKQFERPVTYKPDAGVHDPGVNVTMFTGTLFSQRSGDIFYTLDGADPRLRGGEALAEASIYDQDNGLTLNQSAVLTTRLQRENGDWSALNQEIYIVGTPASSENLIITEIMYHPADASPEEMEAGFTNKDDFEFLELMNVGDGPIELVGSRVSNGFEFDFSFGDLKRLEAGQRGVLVSNRAAFIARYGEEVGPILGEYQVDGVGRLANGGERLTLTGATGEIVTLRYNDKEPWPVAADGDGYSLVLADETGASDPADPTSWVASSAINGSPGAEEGPAVGGETFAQWQARVFTADQLADASVSGPDADSDLDRLTNFAEYAMATNPVESDAFKAYRAIWVTDEDVNYFGIEFQQNTNAEGVEYVVEISEDLQSWTSEGVSFHSRSSGNGVDQVVYRSDNPAKPLL